MKNLILLLALTIGFVGCQEEDIIVDDMNVVDIFKIESVSAKSPITSKGETDYLDIAINGVETKAMWNGYEELTDSTAVRQFTLEVGTLPIDANKLTAEFEIGATGLPGKGMLTFTNSQDRILVIETNSNVIPTLSTTHAYGNYNGEGTILIDDFTNRAGDIIPMVFELSVELNLPSTSKSNVPNFIFGLDASVIDWNNIKNIYVMDATHKEPLMRYDATEDLIIQTKHKDYSYYVLEWDDVDNGASDKGYIQLKPGYSYGQNVNPNNGMPQNFWQVRGWTNHYECDGGHSCYDKYFALKGASVYPDYFQASTENNGYFYQGDTYIHGMNTPIDYGIIEIAIFIEFK